MARLVTIVTATTLGIGISVLVSIRPGDAADTKIIDATSFRCVTSMTPVRQFYVDSCKSCSSLGSKPTQARPVTASCWTWISDPVD